MRDADRVRILASRHQPCVVGHVDEQVRPDAIGDRPQPAPVDFERIRGGARDDHLRAVFLRQALDLVVIDLLGLRVQAVLDGAVHLAAEVHRGAVRQMAAVRQRHAQDRVAGRQHRHVDRRIGLRARMGLNVGKLGPEQLLGPIDREALGLVDVLAAAVVALAGIAFRILVGEHRALRLQHGGTGVVFRGDQLEVIFLPLHFVLDRGPQLRIGLRDQAFRVKHVSSSGCSGPSRCAAEPYFHRAA